MIPQPPTSTRETSDEPPRTLWMGDLDPKFDEFTIQEIWGHVNEPVQVKLIRAKKNLLIPCSSTTTTNTVTKNTHIPLNSTDSQFKINGMSFLDPKTTQLHHAGYCFVEFNTQEDARYGLTLNSCKIPNFLSTSMNAMTNPHGDRTFRLNWASGATLQSSIPMTPEYSLFVGDLAPSVTEADLLTLFQQRYQSVKTVRVMTDPLSGASRCFGFVRFGNQDERMRASLEMENVWLQGRYLRVALASPRNSNVKMEPHAPPLLVETASSLLKQQHQQPQPQAVLQPVQRIPGNRSNTTVFIGGLSSNVTELQLRILFEPFGSISTVRIPPGKKCGFVKYFKRIDAEAALIGMQGFNIGGQAVRLAWGHNNLNETDANNNDMTDNDIQQILSQI